ncbi:MAG: ABC transporter permease subunit [Chloroflexi bacterium]|nr:ABC transporter permease subunit [Chloroflexota bacterium]
MSRFPVAAHALGELRWVIFWFGLGLGIYGAGMVWLFPLFEDYLTEVAATYPQEILDLFGGADMTTPQGYITLEYQSFAVLVLIIYAVVAATGQLAGEEGRGTLEGLLAQPITRSRLMLEKASAVLAGAVLICAIISLGWLASAPFVDLRGELTLLDLIGATFGALPVMLFFAALGFLLGAIAPSRGAAAALVVAFAVASYIAASLAQAIEPISWMRYLSAYHYSDAARWLTEGPSPWYQAGLVAAGLVIYALATLCFEQREIAARTWQFRLLRRKR